jgi:signal transduction histidine kinase
LTVKVGLCQNHTVVNYTVEEGLPQDDVTQINSDKNGYLWVGTNGGLCKFDGKTFRKMSHSGHHPRIDFLLKDNQNRVFIEDGNKIIYSTLVENDSITTAYKLNKKGWILNYFDKNLLSKIDKAEIASYNHILLNELGSKNIKNLTTDKIEFYVSIIPKDKNKDDFTYFMVDTQMVVIKVDKSLELYGLNGKIANISTDLPINLKEIGQIFHGNSASYWLYKNTVFKLKIVNNKLIAIQETTNVPVDKEKDALNCGYKNDDNGNYYFGSRNFGLFEVKPKFFQVNKHTSIPKSKFILNTNHIYYSQLEVAKDEILIANYLVLRKNGNAWYPNTNYPGIRSFNYVDNNENVYYQDGSNITKTNKRDNVTNIFLGQIKGSIESVAALNDSSLLFASPNQVVLIVNDKLKKTLYRDNLGLPPDEIINYLSLKNNNTILLLTNKSLRSYNIQTKSTYKYPNLPQIEFRIRKKLHRGYYFIGTYGGGYFLEIGDKIIKMPLDEKGNLLFAHTALMDKKGYIWISTNNGLYVTRLTDIVNYSEGKNKSIFYFRYDKSNGFWTNEFNGGCQSPAIELKNGMFSFSSMDGLVQFDPNKIEPQFPENPILIKEVSLNNIRLDSIPKVIRIDQNSNEIKLEISSPFFGHPDNLVLEYSIDKMNTYWTKMPKDLIITFPNLSRGNYNLKIRIRRGFGEDNYDYKNIGIIVNPYFYQTGWFLAICFIFIICMIILLNNFLNKQKIRQNLILKNLVNQSTAELLSSNKKLTEQIKMNELYQSILVHDIKAPIRFIESNSKLIGEFWDKIDDDKKITNLATINEAATKMQGFIEETILWSQVKNGAFDLEFDECNVLEILENIKNIYNENSKVLKGQIKVIINCDKTISIRTNLILMSAIIRNLFSNSLKHTNEGEITLYAYKDETNKVLIGCKDQGQGMDQDLINTILEKNYKGNSIRSDSFRMGFVIIKEVVDLLGGKLNVQSQLNVGTNVFVTFDV